jgi:hypothetical protein
MPVPAQKKKLSIRKRVEEILSSTLDWDKTAYHGDIVITNIDQAAEKIEKYFKQKLSKAKRK